MFEARRNGGRASTFTRNNAMNLSDCRKAGSFQLLAIAAVALIPFGFLTTLRAQTNAPQRPPTEVVRDFYKAMREKRFKDAWAMTIYKPAVEDLTAEEMEDLRGIFESRAAQIPQEVEIMGEQITNNTATVFVKVPSAEATPQVTSQPVTLILSNGAWIIGTDTDAATVKRAGRRYFLDALITENEGSIEDFLKGLIGVEAIYAAQHNGVFGDFAALIKSGLLSEDAVDPKITGYNLRLVLNPDGKAFVTAGEPTRYGHTGRLSYWMDQSGNLKNLDNKGKPLSPGK